MLPLPLLYTVTLFPDSELVMIFVVQNLREVGYSSMSIYETETTLYRRLCAATYW